MTIPAMLADPQRPPADRNPVAANARSSTSAQALLGKADASNVGVARSQPDVNPIGPFERLLREIQQSAGPRDSRLNESAASEMFESHPRPANSSSASASSNPQQASDLDARDAKNERTDRFSAARREKSDPNPGQDVDRRIAARPVGASSDRLQAPSVSKPSAAPVVVRSTPSSSSGSGLDEVPNQLGVGASTEPDHAPISNSAPQSQNAATGTASPPSEVLAPQSTSSTSGPPTTSEAPRSASVADKLAPLLAELVRDGAKSLERKNGSFQDELAQFVKKQERSPSQPPKEGDVASSASRETSDARPDRTVPPSPFDAFVRSVRLQGGESRSSARIRLNPPVLGAMTVHVRVDGDRIQLDVRTETADAARRLQSHVAELKSALRQQGLSIDAVAIEVIDPFTAQGMGTKSADSSRMPSLRHLPESERSKRSTIPPLPPRERGRGESFSVWS